MASRSIPEFSRNSHRKGSSRGAKIQGNAKRDRRNTKELRYAGWKVVRIWEQDLKAEPMKCIKKIMAAIGPDRD